MATTAGLDRLKQAMRNAADQDEQKQPGSTSSGLARLDQAMQNAKIQDTRQQPKPLQNVRAAVEQLKTPVVTSTTGQLGSQERAQMLAQKNSQSRAAAKNSGYSQMLKTPFQTMQQQIAQSKAALAEVPDLTLVQQATRNFDDYNSRYDRDMDAFVQANARVTTLREAGVNDPEAEAALVGARNTLTDTQKQWNQVMQQTLDDLGVGTTAKIRQLIAEDEYRSRSGDKKDYEALHRELEGQLGKALLRDLTEYVRQQENAVTMDEKKQAAEDFANEHGGKASLVSIPKKIAGGVLGTADSLVQGGKRLISGSNAPMDWNAPAQTWGREAGTIRGTVSQNLNENTGNGVASFLYNTVMSMADSLAVMPLGGWGSVLLGTAAANDTMQEAVANGATDDQAMALGMIAGAAEVLTEKVSIDSLFQLEDATTVRQTLKNIVKQAIPEASEEATSSIINLLAEGVILGEQSQYEQLVQQGMERGLNRDQAAAQAFIQLAGDVGLDALGGAISGAAFATGKAGLDTALRGAGKISSRISDRAGNEPQAQNIPQVQQQETRQETQTEVPGLQEEIQRTQSLPPEELPGVEAEESQRDVGQQHDDGEPNGAAISDRARGLAQRLATLGEDGETAVELAQDIENYFWGSEDSETVVQRLLSHPAAVSVMEQLMEQGIRPEMETQNPEPQQRQQEQSRENSPLDEPILNTMQELDRQQRAAGARNETERTGILAGATTEQIEQAERIGKLVGREVMYFAEGRDSAGGIQNGYYNREDGRIYVNVNSKNTDAQIIAHELTHSLEQSGDYAGLRQLILQKIQSDGGDLAALRAEKQALYERHGITDVDVDAELVAEYVEQNLLTDEDSIREMVQQNRTLGQRIMEWIDHLLAKLGNKNAREREFLSRAKQYYQQALQQSQEAESNAQQQARSMEQLREQMASGALTEEEAWQVFNEIYDAEADLQNGLRGNRYSYAGENAKSANLRTLTEAQELEKAGAAMESVRMATGWHRGMDGKWRFEIDDSGMEYDRSGDVQRAVSRQWAMKDLDAAKADLRDSLTDDEMRDVRKYNSARVNGNKTEAQRLYEQNAEKYGDVFTDYVETLDWANEFRGQTSDGKRLGDYLKHDALFEAYPTLKNAELRFEKMDGSVNGKYNAEENRITIDDSLRDAPESTLVHEIQHAIQGIEGFTPGASPEYWTWREFESGDLVAERLKAQYRNLLSSLTKEERNKYARYNELEEELNRLFLADENSEDGRRYAEYEAEQDTLYEELYRNEWFRDLLDLERRMDDTPGEYQNMYRNTAGEIEARDASARRSLTAEQRRNTPPEYGNEDTVFANRDDGNEAQSIGRTTSNVPFVEVEQDILAGVPKADWVAAVKENLKQNFPNGIIVESNEINIDRQSRREMTFSGYMKWLDKNNPQLYADKLRATNNADEILLATTGWENESPKHPRKDKIVGFERGNVLLRVGGNDYAADVVVGIRKNGSMLLYDVLNLQPTNFTEKETNAAITTNPSPGAGRNAASVSINSIADSKKFGKKNFSISEEENLSDLDRMQLAALESMKEGTRQAETEQLRMGMPVKARQYLERTERGLLKKVQNALGVDEFSDKAALKSTIREISNEYLRNGTLTKERADALFEQAYQQGIVIEKEFYEQYRDIKNRLRTTAVTLDPGYESSIPDFRDFQKAAFGRLRLVKSGGLSVDTLYQELQQEAPNLFPAEIVNPADQLLRMFDVAKSIQISERNVAESMGQEAETFKRWAKNDFEAAIADVASELRNVTRYNQERAKQAAAREVLTTPEEAAKAYADLKKARWTAEKAKAKNLLTDADRLQVGRLLRGEIELSDLKPQKDNVRGITAVYEASREYEQLAKKINRYKAQQRQKLQEKAAEHLKDPLAWKDKKTGIAYSRETMERNIADIAPDRATADAMIRDYITPVHRAEAKSTRFKTRYRDRVRALNLSQKVQKGNEVSEAYAVQLLGEAEDNIQRIENSRGRMTKRDGETAETWKDIINELKEKNPNLDWTKVENAVAEFRKIYDELFQTANEVRVRNGYEPINYRSGYFPHFQAQGDSFLAGLGRAIGIDTQPQTLPTSINGITGTFRPGITWFKFGQQRKGHQTEYDAVKGFDQYIDGIAPVIYQTDNIQNLRALATEIRRLTADDGIQRQIDAIQADETLTEDEKRAKLEDIYKNGQYSLSNFVNELEEYTNLLANKKSKLDRGMEALIGRRAYTIMKNFESRVGANMVAGNLSSAFTNFIPLTQAGAQIDTGTILQGMWDTLKAYKNDDGFVDQSTFLTNRRGSDPIVQTLMQKASKVMGTPMEYIDNFTADSIVRARFKQNLKRGMSKALAMEEADDFAAHVMADRSKGAQPTLFASNNPLVKAFTQFQLEVNNQFSEVFKDLPRVYRDKGLAALTAALLKYFFGAYLYNEVYEKIVGRRPALDPIGILNDTVGDLTGYELPNLLTLAGDALKGEEPEFETEQIGFGEAGKNLTQNLLGELPFSSGLTLLGVELDGGRIPVSSAIPDLTALWDAATTEGWSGKKRWDETQQELNKLAYLLPPFGGNQIGKVVKTAKQLGQRGKYTVDAEGNDVMQYPVDNSLDNWVRAAMFGTSSLPESQEFYENGNKALTGEQTAVVRELEQQGIDQETTYNLYQTLRRIGKEKKGAEAGNAKRDAINALDLSDEQKLQVFDAVMLDPESDRYEETLQEYRGMLDAGLSWDEVTQMDNRYAAVKTDDNLDATERARTMERWIDDQDWTADQQTAAKEHIPVGRATQGEDRYDYMKERIEDGVPPETVLVALTEGQQEDYARYIQKANVPAETYLDALAFVSNTKSDKDKKGNTISGSRKKKIVAWINEQKLTRRQKRALFLCFYSENDDTFR